ncbi:3-oxoacyl-ACP reductase [Intrasporangium oryzae NRRL B-24470]|uniref:3-oxoacyl-ACP reductase n=1 Tax=Intrasporangium oryzae NRRL B-24470 TaxID=1386089 RepID=W9G8R8_9MICO|nr:3-oxoacyl-ACP reductase [Intrasporangium oryzae]EWT01642.1 3-oxoacyl-ACP reductase [Intrasporangium oryzae NRRL B-24470]
MSDFLSTLIGSPVAKRVGVPQPTRLRRYEPGTPLCDSPVLVAGEGRFAASLSESLRAAGLVTVGSVEEAIDTIGAVVLDLSSATDPEDLDALRVLGAPAVKRLRTNGRVVVIGTDPATLTDVTEVATQRALEGVVRSLGKELRRGATANLVLARGDASAGAWSAVGFFLSGRSAYVDGQVVRVDAGAGVDDDPVKPLDGRVAVVTGAARGIGADIARVLARDGATVVAVDVPSAGDALARVANEVGGTALQLDVTAPDTGTRIVEHAVSRHGGLDIVVHNAGITRDKLFVNMDEARWSSVIDVNLRSILRMNEALLGEGALSEGGRIVCVASIAGIAGNRGQTNYGASKAGVIGLVTALADQVRDRGITVNAVAPGFIETEMTARIPFATREIGRRMNSLQQGGKPKDVAEAIAWLSQPGAAAVTGQVLRVCGQSLLGA